MVRSLREDREQLLRRCREDFLHSPLRGPGRYDPDEIISLLEPALECLADILPECELAPGSRQARELEKTVSFLAANMAASGRSSFDVAALVLSMRNILSTYLPREHTSPFTSYFEWLEVLAMVAFATASGQSERERYCAHLERGMPVVRLTPDLAAALLVGEPDTMILDAVYGRLLLLAVRLGAAALLIDTTGLVDATDPAVIASTERLFAHRRLAKIPVFVVGLGDSAEMIWRSLASRGGAVVEFEDQFDGALSRALGLSDFRLVRRSPA